MESCPFCDGQGIIYKAQVKELKNIIYICDECDSIWLTDDINEKNVINFEIYMNGLGLKGLWSNLNIIDRM